MAPLTMILLGIVLTAIAVVAGQVRSEAAGTYNIQRWDGDGLDFRPEPLPAGLASKRLASITGMPDQIKNAELTSGGDKFQVNDFIPDGNGDDPNNQSVTLKEPLNVAPNETKQINASYTLTWKNKGFDSQGYPVNVVLTDTVVSVTAYADEPIIDLNYAACVSYVDAPTGQVTFMIGHGYYSKGTGSGNGTFIHDISLKLVRTDGTPASGNYLFAMKDLDILDERRTWWKSEEDAGANYSNDVTVPQSSRDEMTTLEDGFGISPVYVPAKNAALDLTAAAQGVFRPAATNSHNPLFRAGTDSDIHRGYMNGTDNRNFTTGFITAGRASGMTFRMQGTACGTGLFTDLGAGAIQTAVKTDGGTITPDTKDTPEKVTWGSTPTVTSTASSGYKIKRLTVNGTDVPDAVGKGTYAVTLPPTDIDKTQTVYVWYEPGESTFEQSDKPGISVKKSYAIQGHEDDKDYIAKAGDVIDYTAIITNTGNVALLDVTIDDPLLSIKGKPVADALEIGQSISVKLGSHTVTAEDVTAGKIDNTVTATGTPESGGDPVTDDDTVTTPTKPKTSGQEHGPAIEVKKSYTVKGHEDDDAYHVKEGDVIAYRATVTNTGSVTLTNVVVDDPLLGIKDKKVADSLEPGKAVEVELGEHTVTAEEVAAGKVDNTVSVRGTPDGGGNPVGDDDTVSTPAGDGVPSMAVRKTSVVRGHEAEAGYSAVSGDVIAYTVTVTNTGRVPLRDVSVDDALLGISGRKVADVLAPGESAQMSGDGIEHVVNDRDVDAGKVDNVAVATATPENGGDALRGEASVSNPTRDDGLASDELSQTGDGMGAAASAASALAVLLAGSVLMVKLVRRR